MLPPQHSTAPQMEQDTATSLTETSALVQCYFTKVCSAPSLGVFMDLHATMLIENFDSASFVKMFDIGVLSGDTTEMQVKAAIE